MASNLALPESDSPWLTIDQAARLARCGKKTLYLSISRGRLRAARIGFGRGTLRIHSDWLRAWLEACATPVEVQQ